MANRDAPLVQDAIRNDHRSVESMFRQIESAGQAEWSEIDLIIRELSIHAAVEEQLVYPAIRDQLGDTPADHSLEEHQEIKELLDGLDSAGPEDGPWLLRSLIDVVRHHVEEEENELLPRFEQALDEQELRNLGARFEDAKSGAPTRPHPHAPSTPPANTLTGKLAGAVDRVRDRMEGRGD